MADVDEEVLALSASLAEARSEADATARALEHAQRAQARQEAELSATLEENEELLRRLEALEGEVRSLRASSQQLEWDLAESHHATADKARSGLRDDAPQAQPARLLEEKLDEAVERLCAVEQERDEAQRDRDEATAKGNSTIQTLQAELERLQLHCRQLYEVSEEMQTYLHAEQHSSSELRHQLGELKGIIEGQKQQISDLQHTSSTSWWGGCGGERKKKKAETRPAPSLGGGGGGGVGGGGDSLAMELAAGGGGGSPFGDGGSRGRSVRFNDDSESDQEAAGGARLSLFSRASVASSASMASAGRVGRATKRHSRYEKLRAEFNASFERQQQRLDEASQEKRALEAKKDAELRKLQQQLKEMQEKMPDDSGMFAGVMDLIGGIQQASDEVVLTVLARGERFNSVRAPFKDGEKSLAPEEEEDQPPTISQARQRLLQRRQRRKGGANS